MRPVAGFIFSALLMLSAEICSAEIQFEGEFRSLLYLQNDRDFDKTPSVFDPQGQWLGLAGSFVSGKFQYAVDTETRLVYSGLLGWNTWGRHDVNQPTPFSPANNAPVLYRHRMLYADWHQDQVGLSVGYQHVVDPSQLIVDQFMPGLQLRFQSGEFKYRGFVGQLPETAFEGWDAGENNFAQDSFLWTGQGSWTRALTTVDLGLFGLSDSRELDREILLHSGLLGFSTRFSRFSAKAYLIGQAGRRNNGAVDGGNQTILAYASRTELSYGFGQQSSQTTIGTRTTHLSPEQGRQGDGRATAFWWSGKLPSTSIWLTENERQDRYDNLDERWAGRRGAFLIQPAGYQMYEIFLTKKALAWRGTLSVTHIANLASKFRGKHSNMGTEFTAISSWQFAPAWHLFADGFYLRPYQGGAFGFNGIDQAATEPVWGSQIGVGVKL